MDDRKPEHLKLAPPSLKAAVRRARVESAEQSGAVVDLREAEIVRLQMLEDALRPVLDQAPEGVDLFDAGIAQGERPRLFIDMISFVDLGHDRRTYRFFQDTRHGRVMIAESAQVDKMLSALTNYIARRLVEREQALASDWRSQAAPGVGARTAVRARQLQTNARVLAPDTASKAKIEASPPAIPPRRFWTVIGDLFSFLLMTIGAFALAAALCVGLWTAWTNGGRDLWASYFGTAPF